MNRKQKHGIALVALVLVAGLAAGLSLTGCRKSDTAPAQAQQTGPAGAEISKVENAFASADPGLRFPLDETLRIVKAGGYGDALPQLRKLAANARLTPEQKQALEELVQKLQSIPAQAAPP